MNVIRSAIHRPVTVSMFVVAVILFGWVSLDRLALNLLPDISYPSLTIQTDYEDAAPEEVEALITRPIEESVGVLPGLTRLSSVSRPGQSEVVLEFGWDTNMDLAALDTREKLDFVTLPRDAGRPVILRFDPSYDPIMRLQLSGTGMSLSRLRYAAERELKRQLESTSGVAAIKVIGGLEEQIRIEIDEKRLAELGIPITEVTRILAQENLNQASGSLYDLDANYMVRMLNQFRDVEEIRGIVVRDEAGRKVVLGDVAKVWRGAKDREIVARINGKESVEMAIYKEGDANTVMVARAVQDRLDALKRANLIPRGVEYQVVFNQADFISDAIEDIHSSAILGGLLAILVLYLFLRDLRSTLLIGITTPISIMATFALMYQTGITLNLMSLGGVALGVGMLVDNSIVVLESVFRHKRQGTKLDDAVFRGTKEVAMAVTASTMTTVAVFLPLIFIEGIAGQLFKDQALTITYSQIVSLIIGLTLIPMLLALQVNKRAPEPQDNVAPRREPSSRRWVRALQRPAWFLKAKARTVGAFVFTDMVRIIVADLRRLVRMLGCLLLWPLNPVLDRFDSGYKWTSSRYPSLLDWALNHKVAVIGFALGLAAVAAILVPFIGAELIPPLTQGEFVFELRLPEGRALEHTDRIVNDMEKRIAVLPGVHTVFSSVGGSNRNQFARETREENVGQLYVVMSDKNDKRLEERTINRIRAELRQLPEVSFTFSRPTFFSFKTPIEVEIYSQDLGNLRATADLVARKLETMRGLSDVRTSTELGNPEIQVRFDRDRLARLGLDEGEIAATVRNKVRGDVASRFREGDKQIEILVRADESDRNRVENIRNLTINMGGNARVLEETPLTETRRNTNGGSIVVPASVTRQQAGGAAGGAAVQARTIPIRLGAVADVSVQRGPSEVRRIRSQRAALVSANLSGRALNSATEEIEAELQRIRASLPADTTVTIGGQNEELRTSYRSLVLAMALAVFLVYLVMASQFESLVHPFIILFSVPLGVIGVIFALALTGTTFNVMVFLGLIILAGIVVNNAIVLIDYANQLREQGLPRREALKQAGEVRLRPILMTTLTSVLGLVPMALGWGEGAEIRTPMAITIMGGLSFSTLLTLIFIPVLYEMIDRKRYAVDEVTAHAVSDRQLTAGQHSPGLPETAQ